MTISTKHKIHQNQSGVTWFRSNHHIPNLKHPDIRYVPALGETMLRLSTPAQIRVEQTQLCLS